MDDTPARNGTKARGERLDSWKEIAAYLKRDIRTAQRWEKQEALPVHRHLHDERGTAYAYSGEIDEWLQRRSRRDHDTVAPSDSAPAGSTPASPQRISRRWPVLSAIAVACSAGGLAIWALSRPGPAPTPVSSLSVVFAQSERFHDWGPDTALSPDGSTLVYIGLGGRLTVRRIDQLSGRVLEETGGSWGPFFSPDGRWIGFNHHGHLKKIPVDGGAPFPLGVTVGAIGAADWGSDDYIVYASETPDGGHGLYRLHANGGTPQLVTAIDDPDEPFWIAPQSIANGEAILSTLARASGSRFQVVAVTVATGAHRVLVDDARHALYIGDGVLVYWRNNTLFAVRLDTDRLDVIGPHVPAWDEVGQRVRLRSWIHAAGTLVYWPDVRVGRRLVWVDRAGAQEPLPLPPALYQGPRLSPDGQTVAYSIGHDFSDVWTHDLSSGATVQLTSDGRSATPVWTPDGMRLIISWQRGTGRELAQLRLNGTTGPEPVRVPTTFLAGATQMPASWADGGRILMVRQYGLGAQAALWAIALDGSREPRPVRPDYPSHGHISPDGRWLAYESAALGRTEVYVTAFATGGQQWKVSTDGGGLPVWSKNGRELFYYNRPAFMAVPVTLGETFSAGTPRRLFEVALNEGEPGSPNYDVASDDRRFLMVFPASTEGPDRLNVIQGWKAQVVRRLDDSR